MLPSTAFGSLIEPAHNPLPDINAGYMAANYDAGTGELSVSGYADHYGDLNGPDIDDGWFSLTAKLTQSSATPMNVSDGTLSIDGTVEGGPSGSLLTGTVDRIGAQLVAAEHYVILDFTFNVTGGALAGDYRRYWRHDAACCTTLLRTVIRSSPAALRIVSAMLGRCGEVANTADTFCTVPEPSSAVLMLMSIVAGLAASVVRRSRTRRDECHTDV